MATMQPTLITASESWRDQPIMAFDLETTSGDPLEARIVTFAIVVLGPSGRDMLQATGLVQPDGYDIPPEATAVHGITTEYALEHGEPRHQAYRHLVDVLGIAREQRWPLVVYNAPYDLTILAREIPGIDMPPHVIDPLVIDKQLDRYRKGSRKLEDVARHYGVELTDAHSALADARATARLAQALGAAHPTVSESSLDELHAAQIQWYAEQRQSFEKYLREKKGDPTITLDRDWPMRGAA
jgi:DNA polymerase III subunit epsilon